MRHSHYLIGVDSDGTAFDSMNLKHISAFIPAAIEVWNMKGEMAEWFIQIEKEVNLFSSLRGINRFPGLLEVFVRLDKQFPQVREMLSLDAFQAYIEGNEKYAPATLKAWREKHPSQTLKQIQMWSERADQLFEKACEGIQPFPGVREALTKASQKAAVAVVSSAAKAGLQKDWEAAGLLTSVEWLMSQEDGSKTAQLQKAMMYCEAPVHALMLGDTQSDGDAAYAAGARFYPILPGEETASWHYFESTVLPAFLEDRYTVEEEEKLTDRLRTMLS
ncbi:MAG: HAD hydrolase-like protein [Clostridia bacterium]|nr:HAD hydrolase-like protein [Clostridia bacterium]